MNQYIGNVYDSKLDSISGTQMKQEKLEAICVVNFSSCGANTGDCGILLKDCGVNGSGCWVDV